MRPEINQKIQTFKLRRQFRVAQTIKFNKEMEILKTTETDLKSEVKNSETIIKYSMKTFTNRMNQVEDGTQEYEAIVQELDHID